MFSARIFFYFFQLTCLHDFFFWLGMNSFFVATAGRNFFSDKFPLHNFFSWELPRNHLRIDLSISLSD